MEVWRKTIILFAAWLILWIFPINLTSALDEKHIWAARCCFGEASFKIQDCLPILHIVKKLTDSENKTNRKLCRYRKTPPHKCRRVTYVEKMKALSFAIRPGHGKNLDRKQLERWRMVQRLPWGDADFWPKKYNERYADIRKVVSLFFDGRTRDPCRNAFYWGGTMDVPKKNMYPVSCANNAAGILKTKKETANTFYGVTWQRKNLNKRASNLE